MIRWYEDEEMCIQFSETPHVDIRYATPSSTKTETIDINKKPFISKKALTVKVIDYLEPETYTFDIEADYTWDGASIPRVFWRLIGAKTDPRFLIPSMIHDVLCENHDYVDGDRYLATKIFDNLLKVSKVNPFTRWLIFHSVDNFQKFCDWSKCG